MTKTIFIANLASTLCLCGVIWIIQFVHYPLFSKVSSDNFSEFHRMHSFLITPLVAPLMLVELAASFLILFYRPVNLNYKLLVLAFVLTLITWASTAFLQVPLHNRLAVRFDAAAHAALVATNRIRTAAWTLRGVLVLYFAWLTFRL